MIHRTHLGGGRSDFQLPDVVAEEILVPWKDVPYFEADRAVSTSYRPNTHLGLLIGARSAASGAIPNATSARKRRSGSTRSSSGRSDTFADRARCIQTGTAYLNLSFQSYP
jgi:hypothetical protein